MADKASNVVLNFKMSGQVEYAKTIREINAIMNAAASEYRTHIAAMGKDADETKKLAAEKQKLEIQLEAARERTKMLRTEYEAMANDTKTTTGQLANKYKQLQNSERAEIALAQALERVNEGLSEQAIESREAEEALNRLESESEALEVQTDKLNAEFELQQAQLGDNASESEKLKLKLDHLNDTHELAQQKVKNYEEQLEHAKRKYGESSVEVDKYETQLLEARTAEQQLANEIESTNKKLQEQQNVLKKTGDRLKNVSDQITDIGKDMSMKVTAPILAAGGASTKAAIDFESAFADVRKTVDATDEEFEHLSESIREMSLEIPTAATEIAGVAAAAGQLGIENEHILTFTRTMIDLGVATDMHGEEAATTLARLANITNMSQADFDRLGSTIVDLGNNFAATEGEIAEMALRIAGAGSQINMSEADILGFSAALTSVGINAEAGGTAISKLMIDIANEVDTGGERLEEFARVAGMSTEEFKRAFEEDAATAIFTFLGGLGDLSEQGESAFQIIEELGLSEVRLRDTILRTSNARELANEALATANTAWQENIALEEEAAERYETTASQIQIFKNEVVDLAIDIGELLIPILRDVIDAIRPWVERFKEMDESTQKFIVIISGIVAAIGPILIVIGKLITAIGSISGAIGTVIGWLGGWAKIMGVIKGALAALTGPIGWVIAAIAALIGIGILLYKNWDTIKEKAIELKDLLVEKFIEIKDNIVEFFTVTIPEAFNNFVEFLSEFPGKVMEFLNKLFTEDIPYAVGYGIGWLITKVSEGIEKTIEFFRQLPGRILEFLTRTINNLTTWASETRTKAIEAGSNFLNNVIDFIKKLPGRVWDFLTETISKMIKFASDMKNKAIETGKNVYNSIVDEIKKLPSRLKELGSDIISGLVDGVKNSIGNIVNTAKNIASSFVDGFKDALRIQSPSRVMMEIGRYIMEGLGIGIEDMEKYAVNKTVDVARGITNAMKDGIELPEMEIGAVVRQPQINTATSPVAAISNIGTNIRESLQGITGEITVHVYLDSNQLNSQLAPGMSKQLNNMNKINARSQGVIIL